LYYIGDHVVLEIASENYRGNTGQRKNMFSNNNGPKVGLRLKSNEVAWRQVSNLTYGSIRDALNELFKRRPRLKALVMGSAEDDKEVKEIQKRAGIQETEDTQYTVKFLGAGSTVNQRPHIFTGYQQQVMEEIDDILSKGEDFNQIIIQPVRY